VGATYYHTRDVNGFQALVQHELKDFPDAKGYALANEDGQRVLWILIEQMRKDDPNASLSVWRRDPLIVCVLLYGDGERPFVYGSKVMYETEGPCYYSVPRAWLTRPLSKPWGRYSEEWRAKVLKST
jgi:hypothetical protein